MGIDTARKCAAAIISSLISRTTPHFAAQIVSARQACEGVKQDYHVFALFNQAFRVIQGLFNNTSMPRGLLIKARGIQFDIRSLHLHSPLRHFFGTFIHQAKKETGIGIILHNSRCDLAQDSCFACLRG